VTSFKIAGIGSFNVHMAIGLRPRPGADEAHNGGPVQATASGRPINQAIPAARASGQMNLITRVGHDCAGDAAVSAFGVDNISIAQFASASCIGRIAGCEIEVRTFTLASGVLIGASVIALRKGNPFTQQHKLLMLPQRFLPTAAVHNNRRRHGLGSGAYSCGDVNSMALRGSRA
jgi:hypothetical protein